MKAGLFLIFVVGIDVAGVVAVFLASARASLRTRRPKALQREPREQTVPSSVLGLLEPE